MPTFFAAPTFARTGVVAGFVLTPPGENLVFNPDFEGGIGWTWVNAFLDTSFYEQVEFVQSSIRLNLGTSPSAYAEEITPHPVTPGQVYDLSVDVLSTGWPGETNTPPTTMPASWTNLLISGPHQPTGTMELQAVFVDGGGSVVSTVTAASQAPTGGLWVTMAGSATVPAGAVGLRIKVALSGETEEDWWADQVTLQLVGSQFVPVISIGVLFAQGTMYRPSLPPVLPAAAASQQSWLFYNSGAGFYWHSTNAPTTSDDAFLGWVVCDADGVVAFSARRLGTGEVEVITPLGPVTPGADAAVVAAPNATAATAGVAAVNIGDVPYYQFSGTVTMPGDTSNLAAVHVVMIDVTGGGSVDHEVYTFRAPLTAAAVLSWKSGLFPTPQGGGALTFTPEFRAENLSGQITTPALDEANLTVNPVAPVVLAPHTVTVAEAGGSPRTQDPVTHFTYTILNVTVDELVATAGGLIPGTRLRVAISPDGGTTWEDQGFWTSYRGGTVGGGLYYETVIPIKINVFAGATNWIARVYAAGATYDPGWSAALTSGAVSIAGLGLPAATLISVLNVVGGAGGSFPYNVVRTDGTQYWSIGDFSFNDAPALADPYGYFVRVTLQDVDASGASVGPEQAFAGGKVTGLTQHTGRVDGDYGAIGFNYVRSGNIAGVKARLYVCSALDQTSQSFANGACATLQTGVGSGAGFIIVPVAAAGATPGGLVKATRLDPVTLGRLIGIDPSTGKLQPRVSAASILGDFDFEQTVAGVMSGATSSAWQITGTVEIKNDTTAYSGAQYCRLTDASAAVYQVVPVRAGESLYAKIYCRSSNTVGAGHGLLVLFNWQDSSGAVVSSTFPVNVSGYIASWTLEEGSAVVPAGIVAAQILVITSATEPSGGDWDVDSIDVYEVKRAASLKLGSGMRDDGGGGTAVKYGSGLHDDGSGNAAVKYGSGIHDDGSGNAAAKPGYTMGFDSSGNLILQNLPLVSGLPTLPNSLYGPGSVVVNSVDSKVYRTATGLVGSWVKSSDPVDLVAGAIASGVTINAAQVNAGTFNGSQLILNLNGITTEITNIFVSTFGSFVGLRCKNNSTGQFTYLLSNQMGCVDPTTSPNRQTAYLQASGGVAAAQITGPGTNQGAGFSCAAGVTQLFMTNAGATQYVVINVNGVFAVSALPSSSPASGSKQFWYDPTDSNRVKFAP